MAIRDLRRRWKPFKSKFANHPTGIRFHRACSWMHRAEDAMANEDLDVAMMSQWIALNSLYGKWDESRAEPEPDRESWRHFMSQVLAIDQAGEIQGVLLEHKKLVMTILDDAYLLKHFWREPSTPQALKTTRDRHQAGGWYIEKNWPLILEAVMNKVYLLRNQLVHGAATHGSKLNRDSIRHCTQMLQHLMVAILSIWIDHGRDEDWGPMCYPPQG